MSGERVVRFERATPGDRCGRCSHSLGDHEGQPCMVPVVLNGEETVCPCTSGVRTDVFLCQQLSKMQQQQTEIIQGLMSIDRTLEKLRLMTGEKYGLDVADLPNGGFALKRKIVGL